MPENETTPNNVNDEKSNLDAVPSASPRSLAPDSPSVSPGVSSESANSVDPLLTRSSQPTLDSPPASSSPQPRKNRKWLWIIIILTLVIVIIAGVLGYGLYRNATAPKPKPTVKVGVLMAFTGGSSSMGYGTMKGIQLAKKQLNATNIELVQADSQCTPNVAREAVKQLIDQKVAAIIGDGCSSASVAVLPTANNTRTVMVSPSASSTALSIPNDYFFRVIPPDSYQAAYMAEAIHNKGIKRTAVFYTNEPYGSNMSQAFQDKFQSLGGQVVATAYGEPDDINLRAQMQKIKDASPDALFIAPNSAISATAAIQVAREVGMKAPLFGGDIFYDQTVITNAPAASAGLTITSFPTGSSAFKQKLLNEYKVAEQLYAAPQAYDAFEAIYRAVEKGAITGEQIKNALPSISFKGASAQIEFNENGEEPGSGYSYDVLQVQNGAFAKLEQM